MPRLLTSAKPRKGIKTMSAGMILLTVAVILFLIIVTLPVVGGGICGSAVLIKGALRKMRANRRVPAEMEKKTRPKTATGPAEI